MSDASDNAIGGVLLQQDDDSEWHPVAYSSRRLWPEESRYAIMERETLVAIHALRVWKLYLFRPFELVTDNLGVTYLQSKKNLTKREARWVEFLADFDVTLVHQQGKVNIADPLSCVDEESSVDLHDPETGEVTESASMKRSEKMGTSEDADGSVFLFCNEDYGLESDAHNNSEGLRTAEVSVSVEPRFQEQVTTGYSRDKKMRHIIQRIKRNRKLQDPYFWNAREEKLYFLSDGFRRLCIPAGPLKSGAVEVVS